MLVHKKFCTEIIKPCDSLLGEGRCEAIVDDCKFCSNEPYTNTVVTAYGITGLILLVALVGAKWRIRRAKQRIQQQIMIEASQ